MKDYKQWTGKERLKSLSLTKKAQQQGLIAYPTKCSKCGQTEGIIQHHNENYDATLAYVPKMLEGTATPEEIAAVDEALWQLCWRCHMMLHSTRRAPDAVKQYFAEVEAGKRWPPVFRHDFGILKREHEIL